MRYDSMTGGRLAAFALAFLLLLPLVAPVAAAQEPWPGGPGRGGRGDFAWWDSPQIKTELGLTPEQQTAIETIVFDAGEKMIDIRAATERARLELTRALAADPIDEAAARKAIDGLVDAESAGARLRHTARFDIARILSKEQRMALMQAMDRRVRAVPRPGRTRER